MERLASKKGPWGNVEPHVALACCLGTVERKPLTDSLSCQLGCFIS